MNNNRRTWVEVLLVLVGLVVVIALASHNGANSRAEANAAMAATGQATAHKQLWHCGMHPQIIREEPGECPICHMALTPIASTGASTDSGQRKILYWWDPMLGPSSISDHPGKSAMGMDLVPVYADQAGPGVTIDSTVVQNMGVRTAPVTRGSLSKTIRAVGLLKIPEPALHDVSLKVGGWIDKLYANQDGMHVTEGQPLFDLYSQDLQVTEQELISAIKSQKALPADASPELRSEAQSLIESAKHKLRLWDVAEQDIDAIARADQPPKDVPFRSPATGHIEDKEIVQGSAVQPMMRLMRVADHTKMWLDAQVYAEQIPLVKIGQQVVAAVDGMPGNTWKGTIAFIYPHLDHMTRTLTVRMTLDNPDFALKPGMYATAQIMTQPLADTIQVPRESIIDTGTRQIAFVSEGQGHFSPRNVKMGVEGDDDQVQIIEGLAPGETVVTSGQFLMDVESRTIEATQKLVEPAASDVDKSQPTPEPQSSPAMREMAESAQSPTTQPATPQKLTVIFCPMVKANWLQVGHDVANPYLGQQMTDCGTIQKDVAIRASDDGMDAVVRSYLTIAKALNADRLDASAIKSLDTAAAKLHGDRYAGLKESAKRLADAKDLPAVRLAFRSVSDRLIALSDKP